MTTTTWRDDRHRRASVLDVPAPATELELVLYREWEAKQRRHHGRNAKPGFHESWRFTPQVGAWVEEQFAELDVDGPVVNVCAGESPLGDLRVDILESKGNLQGTAFSLPLKDESAGLVICDPWWSMAYHLRLKLNRELLRITRRGGGLVWVASWMPDPEWAIEEIVVSAKASGWPSDVLVLVRARRP